LADIKCALVKAQGIAGYAARLPADGNKKRGQRPFGF
jgi:hypothetical protein